MTVALKLGYAPLEQYQHYGKHGPWTDIYSLGAVLYYGLTMNAPCDPMTRFNDDSELQGHLSRLDKKLSAVINKMTALNINGRYAESGELISDLNNVSIKQQKFNFTVN